MQFRGVSANSGTAEGPVCIIRQSEDWGRCKENDIALLVGVKPNTPLASKVKALLSVHGGVTSHVAIVARENNKPAVVGLPVEILDVVRDGQMIKVDATHGIVEVVD